MNKKFRSVFIIASLTAACILVFQLYWIFNSYKTAEKNVKNTIENILEKSVEIYQMEQIDQLNIPPIIRSNDPTLYYTTKKEYRNPGNIAKDSSYSATMKSIKIPEKQLPELRAVFTKVFALTMKTVNLKDLSSIVKKELIKKNLDLDFKLFLVNKNVPLKNTFYMPVHISKKDLWVKAEVTNLNAYIFKQNLIPLLISLILILLSAGSLYFMAITIRRQLKLDDLKNDFINNMTHELRTPISILKSSNEALLHFKAINDPDKAERYLKINDDILNKLDHNVDRILDIAQFNIQKPSVNLVKVIPDELIIPVISRFTVNRNVKIEYSNQLKDHEIYTDPYIIDTILSNLFDNSIKYSRGEEVKIILRLSSVENGFQLYIEDNGKGIAPLYLPYIFDKFFRVPEGNLHNVKGYGLGLNFVKKLVESINGNVIVKSELNVGTTFIIKILNA